ncbi:hypothetical protein LCGC14_2308370, partial [marine sediment metagenome]
LQKQIAKLEKSSNVSGQENEGAAEGSSEDAELLGLSKSEMEGAQLGLDLIVAFENRKKDA